jgi:hypothetical protein
MHISVELYRERKLLFEYESETVPRLYETVKFIEDEQVTIYAVMSVTYSIEARADRPHRPNQRALGSNPGVLLVVQALTMPAPAPVKA